MRGFLQDRLDEDGLLAGAQCGEGHRAQRVSAQLAQGALLTAGPRTGGDRVQGRVQQQRIHGGQHKPDLRHTLTGGPGTRHAPPGDIDPDPLSVAGGVGLHQGPLIVAPHLGHAAPGRLRQHPLLNRQRHRSRHNLQAASHQRRLG